METSRKRKFDAMLFYKNKFGDKINEDYLAGVSSGVVWADTNPGSMWNEVSSGFPQEDKTKKLIILVKAGNYTIEALFFDRKFWCLDENLKYSKSLETTQVLKWMERPQ